MTARPAHGYLYPGSSTIPRGYEALRRTMGNLWETSSRGSWAADVKHYMENFLPTPNDLGQEGMITYALTEGKVAVSPYALLAHSAQSLSSTYCVYLDAGGRSPAAYILPRVRAYVAAGARNISILISGQSDLLILVSSLMKEVRDNNWRGDFHHITVTLWLDLHHPDVFALATRPEIQSLCFGERESLCLGFLVPGFLKEYLRHPQEPQTSGSKPFREFVPTSIGGASYPLSISDNNGDVDSKHSSNLGQGSSAMAQKLELEPLSASHNAFSTSSQGDTSKQTTSAAFVDDMIGEPLGKKGVWTTIGYGSDRSSALSLYRKYGKLYERSYQALLRNEKASSTANVVAFLRFLVNQSMSSELQIRVLNRDTLYEQCKSRPPVDSERDYSGLSGTYYESTGTYVVIPSHCGEAPMLTSGRQEIIVFATYVVYPNVLGTRDEFHKSITMAKRLGDEAIIALKAGVKSINGFPSLREPTNDRADIAQQTFRDSRLQTVSLQRLQTYDNLSDLAHMEMPTSLMEFGGSTEVLWQPVVGIIGVSSALSSMEFPESPIVDRETLTRLSTPLLPFVYPLAGTLVSHLWDVSEGVWTFQSPIRYIGESSSFVKSSIESASGDKYFSVTDGPFVPLIEKSFRDWSSGRHLDSHISVAEQSRQFMIECLQRSNQTNISTHLGSLLRTVCSSFASPANIRIGISDQEIVPRFSEATGNKQEAVFDMIVTNLIQGCAVVLPEIYPFTHRGQPIIQATSMHPSPVPALRKLTFSKRHSKTKASDTVDPDTATETSISAPEPVTTTKPNSVSSLFRGLFKKFTNFRQPADVRQFSATKLDAAKISSPDADQSNLTGHSPILSSVFDTILSHTSKSIEGVVDKLEQNYMSKNKGLPGGLAWPRL